MSIWIYVASLLFIFLFLWIDLARRPNLLAAAACPIGPVVQCRPLHTTISRMGLDEFFDLPENWGESTVKSGRDYIACQISNGVSKQSSPFNLYLLYFWFKVHRGLWHFWDPRATKNYTNYGGRCVVFYLLIQNYMIRFSQARLQVLFSTSRYLLLKEKNMLLTIEQEAKRQRVSMPSPERLKKVKWINIVCVCVCLCVHCTAEYVLSLKIMITVPVYE